MDGSPKVVVQLDAAAGADSCAARGWSNSGWVRRWGSWAAAFALTVDRVVVGGFQPNRFCITSPSVPSSGIPGVGRS